VGDDEQNGARAIRGRCSAAGQARLRGAKVLHRSKSVSASRRHDPPDPEDLRVPQSRSPLARDRHVLYEASVQSADYDLDFFERVYRRHHGRSFRRFREDFCGTAMLSCAWALRRPENESWGVDLDAPTLAWAKREHLARMHGAARRVTLVRADVREVTRPKVDLVTAMNFSYWIFRERDELRNYFRAVRRSLKRGGLFVANIYGGSGAMEPLTEKRRIAASQGPDGLRIPGFTYVWEQASFNPIDHRLKCHIHFKLSDGRMLKRAFSYDWRMWTLPEVRETLHEAGFAATEVYVEGWNHTLHEPDQHYRRRATFDNQEGWLAFVVATT
jgi:SAM-dependent methyltransferase